MLFRRMITAALAVGFIAACFLTLLQTVTVSPIIFAAETFEIAEPAVRVSAEPGHTAHGHSDHGHSGHGHNDHGHHHDSEAWAPEDGAERTFYTLLSNTLAGIGFTALMLGLMAIIQLRGKTTLTPLKGLAWGMASFMVFFAAPGVGLPPEIPGIEAATIENRQGWWFLAVIGTAVGLYLLVYGAKALKVVGLFLLVLPHLVGAPHLGGPEFAHPDPAAVAQLEQLHHQFIMASSVSNLLFWLVVGVMSAWVLNRHVLKGFASLGRAEGMALGAD